MPVDRRRPRFVTASLALAASLGVAVGLAACNAAGSPSATSATAASPSAASPSDPSAGSSPPTESSLTPVSTDDGGSAGNPGEAGQTDTDWGRIWDELPPGFPTYPGSTPTATGSGPVTAELAVPADVETVVPFMQAALEGAEYSTEALSGPMEDGSIIIDSVRADSACRVQTVVAPTGGTTIMTVRYGAECPFG